MGTFDDLRVLVTGGTAGLGLAIVRALAARGARVAFVARKPEGVERVARDLAGTHGIVGDVARKDDIYPIALQALGELGGLDVLINNASDLGPASLRLLAVGYQIFMQWVDHVPEQLPPDLQAVPPDAQAAPHDRSA